MLINDLITLVSTSKDNKNKKVYEITTLGKKLISYEIKRLREMLNNGILELGDYYE